MKYHIVSLGLAAALLGTSVTASAGESQSADDAAVYFINLENNAKVTNPVHIQFGLAGMGIAPAGTQLENTGHHHLLINETIEGDEVNAGIPADEQHIHFGKGQTEATLDLPKGTHTLQLVLGDWSHIPHANPVMSERITITVE